MKTFHAKKSLVLLTLALATLSGCGSSSSSDETVSEIATANVAGTANATENNGSFTAALGNPERGLRDILREAIVPIQEAFAAEQCPVMMKDGDCTADGGIITLTYANCQRGRATWNGSETFAFSSEAVCQARTDGRGVPVSGSVVRTFGGVYGDAKNPATTATVLARQVSFDTTTPYGYATKVAGGVEVDFGLASNGTDPQRTIKINGIREVLGSVSGDAKVRWDHSLSTDAAHPIVIVKSGPSKVIQAGGVVELQHNLAKFTATTTITEDLKFSNGCCHPVGGSVQTTFTADASGLTRGKETLVFSNSCGVANLTATDGSTATILLKHCF